MPQPNQNKNLVIAANGVSYERYPVKTHIVSDTDSILDIAAKYAKPFLQLGDQLFISERIVAITQGRAYPIGDIHSSFWAKFFVKFVHKTPYGIGLGSPWTMELAIREAGLPRIFIAALASAITKPFGMRGVFYRVVGKNINAIDGPCANTLPPYNGYAKLGPKDPEKVANSLESKLGVPVAIIDANDLGVNVLGRSQNAFPEETIKAIMKDNPLGQSTQQTPMALVRKI